MDHGQAYASWGAGAFWLFIAAAAVANHWERSRRNTEKHETLRRIIEKTGSVDETRLKELFNPSAPDWISGKPGSSYRGLMVAGTIVLSVAAGVALLFATMGQAGVIPHNAMIIGMAAASVPGMVGVGLFFATRFVEKPPEQSARPPAR